MKYFGEKTVTPIENVNETSTLTAIHFTVTRMERSKSITETHMDVVVMDNYYNATFAERVPLELVDNKEYVRKLFIKQWVRYNNDLLNEMRNFDLTVGTVL